MPQTILTLTKALTVIEELSRAHHPLGVSELSRSLGLSKNQVFRVLKTLEAQGYVRRSGEKYQLGLKFLELGRRLLSEDDLVQIAIGHLNRVRNETGECVCLFVLDDRQAVCTALREGLGLVNITARVGQRYQLHAGAAPKAILAHQSDDFIEAVMEHSGLPAYTPYTITDPAKLLAHLSMIRERGYALSAEDMLIHAFEVSVPIYDQADRVQAALSVTGPVDRFGPAERVQAVEILAGVCDQISAALGSHLRPSAHLRRVAEDNGSLAYRVEG